MWLVVGLGNPGPEYEATYHNVGFRVVDRLAEQHGVRIRQQCGPAIVSDKIVMNGEVAVLVQPQTFMNRSGLVLAKLFERYEAALQELKPADREAIIARIELQQSYEEVAIALGKPSADSARMAVTRAIARLISVMSGGKAVAPE